jgi:hypothetical protein
VGAKASRAPAPPPPPLRGALNSARDEARGRTSNSATAAWRHSSTAPPAAPEAASVPLLTTRESSAPSPAAADAAALAVGDCAVADAALCGDECECEGEGEGEGEGGGAPSEAPGDCEALGVPLGEDQLQSWRLGMQQSPSPTLRSRFGSHRGTGVFLHRGAGSTIGCGVVALWRYFNGRW